MTQPQQPPTTPESNTPSRSAPPSPSVSHLAAKVAHELNNPLDAVLRFVSLARRKASAGTGQGYPEIDRYLADAQFGLQRMTEVLRELMDIGRQTNDILKGPAAVPANAPTGAGLLPLTDLVSRATRTAAALAEQKHVSLILKSLLPDSFSPAYDLRLAQILSNLLKNALEAAPQNSSVRLTIRSGQWPAPSGQKEQTPHATDHWPLATDHLIIEIEDHGPGIPPELLPQLFTPFLTTKPSGSGHGLGLAISKELALSLNGSLTLQNRPAPNTGCLATLTLPLNSKP